jgi:uncharacterized glyoxalase superfamily protein PhnB
MNQENNAESANASAPIDLTIAATKIVAIGSITEKGMPLEDRFPVLLKEVPATVALYLSGKIDNWFVKVDATGVVFIMNVTTVEEAHTLLEALPFGQVGMMTFDLIPVGPLSPLRLLINKPLA